MPAVAVLAPESCLPDEDLLLNCTQHDEDQSEGSELSQYPECHSQPTRQLGQAEEAGKARAHPDALTSGDWVLKVTPAAGDEHQTDQESHEEEGKVAEAVEPVDGHQVM